MVIEATKRVVTYERTSSEDQKERETIKAQTEELARRLNFEPGVQLVERFVDDGVSGTIPLALRPAGMRLLEAARLGRFQEVWVYKIDRLGRDDVDPLIVWRDLEALGVKVHSVTEGVSSLFEYHIRVAMAAEERRTFLARSAAGMEIAVRQGRYPGGIVSYGYRVDGVKREARLVLDDEPVWGHASPSDIIRFIFEASADGWSDQRIAHELDSLGVPTSYNLAGRAVRGKRTQDTWRQGRVTQILKNSTYYGEYQYRKRSSKPTITASVPAIVSKDLWTKANDQRRLRARKPREDCRKYLLASLLKCDICNLNYSGNMSKDKVWYRCNGSLRPPATFDGRCKAKGIKGDLLEPLIRADIAAWLANPGELLAELQAKLELDQDGALAAHEAELITLRERERSLENKLAKLIDLYVDSGFSKDEIERRRIECDSQLEVVRTRIRGVEATRIERQPVAIDLHEELRKRARQLSEQDWIEIVHLLVGAVRIQTTIDESGKKEAKAIIEYRFGPVANNDTGKGSSQRSA